VLDLVEQACAREVFVSYDANLRETFVDDPQATRRDVLALAQRCTLVKLSDEDAQVLGEDPDEFARTLTRGERTRLVLLTRGAGGATAFTSSDEVSAQPRSVEVVDTVGAGDAFMAATLAQLDDLGAFAHPTHGLPLRLDELRRLLRGAMEVAAITCERRGANPPRRSELPPGWPA
jgi:fructokinase